MKRYQLEWLDQFNEWQPYSKHRWLWWAKHCLKKVAFRKVCMLQAYQFYRPHRWRLTDDLGVVLLVEYRPQYVAVDETGKLAIDDAMARAVKRALVELHPGMVIMRENGELTVVDCKERAVSAGPAVRE